ncbi:MAG: zinc-binding dehydrogenase [Pseudomonadota bacterium]
MRAILLQNPGETSNRLDVVDVARPAPGAGEVLIEVAYGGCNFADTMMRDGTYPHPKGYPLVAGLEVSGRIAAVGDGVEDLAPGDRVAAFCEDAGGFAELCLAPAMCCVPLPDAIGLDVGAALPIQALTAWHLLHTVSTTRPGDVLLIHAIGGGVGLHLTQLGVAAGARVIGTVGTRGKERRPLEYGAERVINREDEDFVAAVAAHAGPSGVDKVVDSTGASILDRSFGLVRKLGHVVSYGEAEGRPLPNLWERLVERSLTFTRFHLGHSDFLSEQWAKGHRAVTEGVASGSHKVPIAEVFAFEEVARMYDTLRSRQVAGKLLLSVNP